MMEGGGLPSLRLPGDARRSSATPQREGCAGERSSTPQPRSGEEAGGDGFGVALDSGELAGNEDVGAGAELEGFGEDRWGVDVCVAVDLAVAEELCILEAGDEAEDAGLSVRKMLREKKSALVA